MQGGFTRDIDFKVDGSEYSIEFVITVTVVPWPCDSLQ